jgi:hypothetical protein
VGRGPGFGVHLCFCLATDIGCLLDQKMRVVLSRQAVKAGKGAVKYMKVSWSARRMPLLGHRGTFLLLARPRRPFSR